MIFIQSNKEKTLPHHFDAACALYGAIDRGIKYRLVTFEEVQSGSLDILIKPNVFVGSVEFMREVFSRIGKSPRVPKYSDREHLIMNLGEIRKDVADNTKWFVKPVEIKTFTGLVVDQITISCLKDYPDDMNIIAYEPFKNPILSEWRIYIHNNNIMAYSGNYAGDFVFQPDYKYISGIIIKNKSEFPCSYTIDVAVFEGVLKEKCEIIEYNDMWAIGNYGMENDRYLQLLMDRYYEIVRG